MASTPTRTTAAKSPKQDSPFTSKTFHVEDTDTITFISSDNVHFHIHRKNLETQTSGLPPSRVLTRGQSVRLTETGETLELLFLFVYPKRHPDLVTTPFETLAPLAEAAEKYEVFPAINTCRLRMRDVLQPGNAVAIFDYASRHDYKDILVLAAPLLLDLPFEEVVKNLAAEYVVPWMRYRNCWSLAAFSAITKHAPEHYVLSGNELRCASRPQQAQPLATRAFDFGLGTKPAQPNFFATSPSCQLNTSVRPSQLWVSLGEKRSRSTLLVLYDTLLSTCSENHHGDYYARRTRLENALNAVPGFDTFL